MSAFSVGGVTGRIMLYTTKGPNQNGEYPVKVRLIHQRKAYFINLNFSLSVELFDRLYLPKIVDGKEVQKRLKKDENTIKKLITASFERVENEVKEIHRIEEYTHEKLRNRLQRGRKIYIDVAFDNKIAELKENGQVGTASSYETARNFILKYDDALRFVDVTPQWLNTFEAWALNKEGINETSLSIYLRTLRTLFNTAIRNKDVPRSAYPFASKDNDGYTIPQGTGTKIALTIEQMNAIARLELAGSLERCRDVFLLSFHLGGINIKDLLLLKWKNLKGGEVHFIREKTKTTNRNKKSISVPYTDNAKRIVERWGNDNKEPDAYVIPYLTDKLTPEQVRDNVKSYTRQMNKQLKRIGSMVGIDGLTTYVARHSFATILKNSGAPVAFIGETLGHTSTKTTESYLKSFESEQKKKHFEILSNIG